MLTTLAVANYRSLRAIAITLSRLNLVTGPNGSGKSNLYRALRLLVEAAQGGVVNALAREGGLPKTLWAGPDRITPEMERGEIPVQGTMRKDAVGLKLGFAGEDFGYAIDLGFPPPPPPQSAFTLDPQIKCEAIWSGPFLRSSNALVERRNATARIRSGREWKVLSTNLNSYESIFTQMADPHRAPEVLTLRDSIRAWRFYDHFRIDMDAPTRASHIGTRTPVLSQDGHDLAAAWQTILEIGDERALERAVSDAFPGASIEVIVNEGRFGLLFHQHGLLRPLSTAELSDGTLRYLLWIAALHTPRPPPLMVLNEPETSLHPDLLPALGRLIVKASARSQIWVVSHASRLIAALEEAGCNAINLEKNMSQTRVLGQRQLDEPAWYWPDR
jgi:predicted ATPase